MAEEIRVLVVDDEESNRELVKDFLGEYLPGLKVKVARTPASALEIALQEEQHAIVTDLEMGNMNGIELLTELGKSGMYQDIFERSIVMTANPEAVVDYNNRQRDSSMMVRNVISKPIKNAKVADNQKSVLYDERIKALDESNTLMRRIYSLLTYRGHKVQVTEPQKV